MSTEEHSCAHKASGGPGHHIWHSTGLDVRNSRLVRTYCCYGCRMERTEGLKARDCIKGVSW